MFGFTRIAIAAAALATAGSGSAAVLACNPPPPSQVDAAARLSAKADAELSAAQQAHDKAVTALSSTDASVKAQAKGLLETSATKLDDASVSMKAAVDAGSKTAVDGIATFTSQTTKLVNSLAITAGATANASVNTGTHLVSAVDTQLAAARTVATTSGAAAVKALTSTKVSLPQPSVPQPQLTAQISGDARSDTNVSAPATSAASSLTGNLGIKLG